MTTAENAAKAALCAAARAMAFANAAFEKAAAAFAAVAEQDTTALVAAAADAARELAAQFGKGDTAAQKANVAHLAAVRSQDAAREAAGIAYVAAVEAAFADKK